MSRIEKNELAVTNWLEDILSERFGIRITLQKNDSNFTFLSIENETKQILIKNDFEIFDSATSELAHTEWDASNEGLVSILNNPLPAPGFSSLSLPLVESEENKIIVNYDILSLVYWVLSRKEEVGRDDLDEHGRFPASSSHAFKHGYLERPIIDEWLDILQQLINSLFPHISLKKHNFLMRVSHDVDSPSRYGFRTAKDLARAMVGDVIKRKDFIGAIRAPLIRLTTKNKIHKADPLNTFEWLMDLSEKNNIISAFYFICGRTHPKWDSDYEVGHKSIRNLIKRISDRGHEIGLHPSYNTYKNPDALILEANCLKKICADEGITQKSWGGRMHYLRWETPTTLYAWEQAHMTYDSTLGYADLPGFRCGTCYEYPAFDPVKYRKLNLRIRPLIAMESTVMSSKYLGLGTGNAALEKFIELKNICRTVSGDFTLLWHNSEFLLENQKMIYEKVIMS